MKKTTSILFFLISTVFYVSAQQWVPVGSPGFSASGSGVCNWQNIVIDKSNNIYISYNDEGFGLNNGNGTVMKFDGSSWVSIGTPGFTEALAHHSSFALGNGDTVYFAYSDGTSTALSKGAVMMFDGTSWKKIGSSLTQGACQYSSIVMSKDGSVYFGAIDIGLDAMIVKKYDGNNTWTSVGTPNPVSLATGAAYSSMTLDNHDTLYVAYQDKSAAPGMVRVKKFNGTSWVEVGSPFLSVTGPGTSPAQDIHIAFNNKNDAYVAYSHGFQGPPKSSVHKFDGTNWTVVGSPQFPTTNAPSLFNKLAFDEKGTPYLALQNHEIGTKASVMKFNGTSWDHVGNPGISSGVAAHTSIAMDQNGNPYVIFFDEDNGLMNTVMKYTNCKTSDIQSIIASDTTVCIGDSVSLNLTGTLNDATDWEWYSGSCDGSSIGSGNTVYVNPFETTTYYARGLGGCVAFDTCGSITVNVTHTRDLDVNITVSGFILSTTLSYSTYQWFLNGNILNGETNSNLHIIENGEYSVAVSNENGCVDTSARYKVTNVNNITDANPDNIRIYPNPATDIIYIITSLNKIRARLTSLEGKIITQTPIDYKHAILTQKLADGMYILQINDENGKLLHVEKIIKRQL